jgi:hypothetical protein
MPYTWTELVRHCARCNRDYRVSQESLNNARQNYPPIATDTEIADDFEYCLSCCNGERNTGEHITSLDAQVAEMWDIMRDKAAKYDALVAAGYDKPPFTLAELVLLEEALDSHAYWQIAEQHQRNDGFVYHGEDDENHGDLLEIEALEAKVQAMQKAIPEVEPLTIEESNDRHGSPSAT